MSQHDHDLDPFTVLRLPGDRVTPRPAFAAELRARLAAEFDTAPVQRPQGALMSTITPYLAVRRATEALDFYRDAFGAVEDHRIVDDDGRVGHAEMSIDGARFYLSDEYPDYDAVGPESLGGATCALSLTVADVDASYERAIAAGATSGRPPSDEFYGRAAWVRDPFGHRWNLAAEQQVAGAQYDAGAAAGGFQVQRADPTGDPQVKHYDTGDLYYFTIPVGDLTKAQTFFGGVLGWHFDDPTAGHVSNIAAPPGGVRGGDDAPQGVQLWFVVDDIHAAVDAVRRMGGTASEPVLYESGWAAECVDDQGTVFNLSVPSAAYSR